MYFLETEQVPQEEKQRVRRKLWAYNTQYLEDTHPRDLAVFCREEGGRARGALIGWTLGLWLHVEYLWVEPDARRQKIGTRLLCRAQQAAIRRGCKYVLLDTLSFQAPGFYEKTGIGKCLPCRNTRCPARGISICVSCEPASAPPGRGAAGAFQLDNRHCL